VGIVRRHRERGARIVFTNGCFDVLHRGHVGYLAQARELGDVLIVAVNSDQSVRRLKGPQRPVNHVEDRVAVLAALACVDHVVVFEEDSPAALIEAIRPDVYVKGGDYPPDLVPEAPLVRRLHGEVRTLGYVPGPVDVGHHRPDPVPRPGAGRHALTGQPQRLPGHPLGRQVQALEPVRAAQLSAGRARRRNREHRGRHRSGPELLGLLGAGEQDHRGDADRVGQVRAPAVVADHHPRAGQRGGQRRHVQLAGRGQHSRPVPGDPADRLGLRGRTTDEHGSPAAASSPATSANRSTG
jgi:rfaE bifunctional protein nucleotidyltransferase chain/domain